MLSELSSTKQRSPRGQHMRVVEMEHEAETVDFPFETARRIAAELNGDMAPSPFTRPLIYLTEDVGDGRARVAALQHGMLAFYL